MSDLLKKADQPGSYPDDAWREILHANGFTPSGVSEEVWRSPHSGVKVKIDVDRETEEPYYQVITEDGTSSGHWTDPEALKTIVEPKEAEEPQPMKLSPEDEKKFDDDFMRDMKIVGHQRTSNKFAGRPPRFSFAVPMQAAATVAFHLAKAGMKDFDVEHFKEDEFSVFNFSNEPEMHVAEEIVKTEYADQIRSRKGLWGMWAETHDPTQPSEQKLHQQKYVASVEQDSAWETRSQGKYAGQWGDKSYDSDAVHDILDKHRPQDVRGLGFDEAVPDERLSLILKELDGMAGSDNPDHYLGIVVFLVTHGSNVPKLYRERARQIAFALVQDEEYLNEWQNPDLRQVELENEIELLEGDAKTAEEKPPVEITDEDLPEGFFSDKSFEEQRRERGEASWEHPYSPRFRPTAGIHPDDLKGLSLPSLPSMSDAEIKRMETYRRKKLVAWLNEMGFLDAQGNGELLAEYDAATDFHEKDRLYEEARDMIKDERKEQTAYRRRMRP
jgi:hypothetical protein